MKLAKLDFLLRYPAFLESLNNRREIVDLTWLPPREAERKVVDAPMIRYKYGPWDHKYYAIVGSLVGRGLAEYSFSGKAKLGLKTTEPGTDVARQIRGLPEWRETVFRLDFIAHHYDLDGDELARMIYDAFPQMIEQPIGETIEIRPGGS
jgi:hypothetical protein